MCQQKKNKNSNQAQRSGDFMRQKWRIYGLSDNATDAYSDIDFGLITTDEAYDDFFPSREALIRLLGEPIFLEVFSDYGFDIAFTQENREMKSIFSLSLCRKQSLTSRSWLCQTWNVVTWRCWSPECLPIEKALSRRNKDVIYSSLG